MNKTFEIKDFIDKLIKDMGMDKYPAEKIEKLKNSMYLQVSEIVYKTASMYIEPEVAEYVLLKNTEEKDISYILRELIKNSPRAQIKILEELSDFYDKTIETYMSYNK